MVEPVKFRSTEAGLVAVKSAVALEVSCFGVLVGQFQSGCVIGHHLFHVAEVLDERPARQANIGVPILRSVDTPALCWKTDLLASSGGRGRVEAEV